MHRGEPERTLRHKITIRTVIQNEARPIRDVGNNHADPARQALDDDIPEPLVVRREDEDICCRDVGKRFGHISEELDRVSDAEGFA